MYNEDFIAEMKDSPESWGRNQVQNLLCTSKGHVEIYNPFDVLCSIYKFCSHREKGKLVTKACNDVKRLKGYYVVISFLDYKKKYDNKRKRKVFQNIVVDSLF